MNNKTEQEGLYISHAESSILKSLILCAVVPLCANVGSSAMLSTTNQ